jgi:DNA-directed RNA polymerase subunit RPC12/RpoP
MAKNTREMDRATIMFLDKMLPDAGDVAMKFLADPFGYSICYKRNGKRAEAKNLYWCADCGASFPLSDIKDYRKNPDAPKNNYFYGRTHIGICPHCGKKIYIEHFQSTGKTFHDVVSTKATMGDWQITRYFHEKVSCKPNRPSQLELEDLGADWTKDGYTYRYIARQGGMFYSKYWKADTRHFSEMRMEDLTEEGDVTECYDMPAFSLDAELAKRGISLDALHGIRLTKLLDYMNNDAHFETLWKQGDWEMAKFFSTKLYCYWNQIRIARKHGYKIENLTEWRDMIDLMRYDATKDINSPKYICPANLHDAHNAVLEEHERRERARRERLRRENDERMRREAEEAMKDAIKCEEEFIKRRQKYFGISIPADNGKFTIVCLKSINEFKEEGSTLNHCVFRAGYYNKEDSLILSARDKDNRPIETLEIDLCSFNIRQCYGDHDTHTALHKSILDTMEKNMWQVKEIRTGKKMKVAC